MTFMDVVGSSKTTLVRFARPDNYRQPVVSAQHFHFPCLIGVTTGPVVRLLPAIDGCNN